MGSILCVWKRLVRSFSHELPFSRWYLKIYYSIKEGGFSYIICTFNDLVVVRKERLLRFHSIEWFILVLDVEVPPVLRKEAMFLFPEIDFL